MLEVEAIRAGYGPLDVVRGVSLDVGEGQFVVLLGANGAGKSTVIRSICGLNRLRAGQIRFEGKRIDGLPPYRIVDSGLVVAPEGRKLFGSMTARENLWLGGSSPRARVQRAQSIEWVFHLFPRLKERESQIAGTLSGGEQQMLCIGRALMARPRLLVLDEPSIGLAPKVVADVLGTVAHINKEGIAVLLVEQNVPLALKLCSRGFVLENGLVALSGSGEELQNNPHLKRAYLGL